MEIGSLSQILNEDRSHNRAITNNAVSVYKHLILSKIAPNHYSASHWSDEIDIYSEELKDNISVEKKGKVSFNSNDVDTLKKGMDDIYRRAKNEARKEESTRHDPIPFDQIPDEPEWSIDDILTKDKTELIPGIVLGGRREKRMERESMGNSKNNKKRRR